METNLVAVEQTFQLFALIGKAVIDIIKLKQAQNNRGQQKDSKIDLKGELNGEVTVRVGLDPRFENLIRDLLLSKHAASSQEAQREYWVKATCGLIAGQELKFEHLVQLDVEPVAIGTEAMMMRHDGDSHEDMIEIATQYLQTFALKDGGEQRNYPALPPPAGSTFGRVLARISQDLGNSEHPSIEDLANANGRVKKLDL